MRTAMRSTLSLPVLLLAVACGGGSRRPQAATSPEATTAGALNSSQIQRECSRPIEEVLAGKVSGVTVARNTQGGLTLRIRGGSSILGDNDPLYVIDGIAIQPGPDGALYGINPCEIERIEVKKDAASMSAYGSRGANGVIVIRMKKA
jgi:TonB-dependent SusC/RagA subfamily outer membrane receptor